MQYPQTRTEQVVDNYFGTEVADPYRWLEDDNAEETKNWVKAQNEVTRAYLNGISFLPAIKQRLTQLWDYPKVSAPFKKGPRYYEFRNTGLQAQSVLYGMDSLGTDGEVVLDPNGFSEDGTVSLAGMAFSKDHKYLAYGISRGGSDWNEWFVMDVETKELLDDKIEWVKFGGASWYGSHGFFYTRFPAPGPGEALSGANTNGKVYFHRLGSPQSSDLLIWEDPANPTYYNFGGTTHDDRFFVLNQSQGTHGQNLFVLPLTGPDLLVEKPAFVPVVTDFDNDHQLVDNDGDALYILTNYQAPNYRLVKTGIAAPGKENWVNVLPESNDVLQSASLVGGKWFSTYLKDASSRVYAHEKEGKQLGEINLPTIGTVSGFGGNKEDEEIFYTFTSFTYPSTVFRYEVATGHTTLYRQSEVTFNPADYETKEVFYPSADGEKIHMFITHKKGLAMDGQRPTLLYGYGGFNISLSPSFSVANVVLLENGGVYCVANLRGGGEYGERWHQAGMLLKKQHVFDDFIAAGEYLISEGYTSKDRLAIRGGSNGGLLVGACMVQRPDLFKVAFPAVGVLDMLRYHKFTVGAGWAVEYGSSDEETHFKNLYAYSPYHNLQEGTSYPATMVMTADHDDRVVPAHSFKFAARLQACHKGPNPVLINIETKAGHGAGKSTQQTIDEYADIWAFMFANMGVAPIYGQ